MQPICDVELPKAQVVLEGTVVLDEWDDERVDLHLFVPPVVPRSAERFLVLFLELAVGQVWTVDLPQDWPDSPFWFVDPAQLLVEEWNTELKLALDEVFHELLIR